MSSVEAEDIQCLLQARNHYYSFVLCLEMKNTNLDVVTNDNWHYCMKLEKQSIVSKKESWHDDMQRRFYEDYRKCEPMLQNFLNKIAHRWIVNDVKKITTTKNDGNIKTESLWCVISRIENRVDISCLYYAYAINVYFLSYLNNFMILIWSLASVDVTEC